jgi:hypothetical protein
VFHRQLLERRQAPRGKGRHYCGATGPSAAAFSRTACSSKDRTPGPTDGSSGSDELHRPEVLSDAWYSAVTRRDFEESDNEKSPNVVIINESMANQFWPDQDLVGKRFKFFGDSDYRQVVAIAKDSKYNSLGRRAPSFCLRAPPAALTLRNSTSTCSLKATRRAWSSPYAARSRAWSPLLSLLNIETLGQRVHPLSGRTAYAGDAVNCFRHACVGAGLGRSVWRDVLFSSATNA